MVAQIDRCYVHHRWQRALPRLLAYTLFEGRPLTTRGRWINPLVFANMALLKRLPLMQSIDRPVFITGMGRSGSTLLGVVLSMHRDVGFLNEPKALWHCIHAGEDVIGNYSKNEASYRLDAADCSDEMIDAAHRLYAAYLRLGGNSRIVDKYPEMLFRTGFVRHIFPDARFLFLVRNGWDTCQSVVKWSQCKGTAHGQEIHDWWGTDARKWRLMVQQLLRPDPRYKALSAMADHLSDHRLMAATEWIVTMREGLRQMQLLPDAVLMVRYEDLVSKPEETLQQIVAFTGLAPDPVMYHYASQSMRAVSSQQTFPMPEPIASLFRETMHMLGYHDQ